MLTTTGIGGQRIHIASDYGSGRRHCGRQSSNTAGKQQCDSNSHLFRIVDYADGDLRGIIGSAADGVGRESEQRHHGGRYGGDDHRSELRVGATVMFGSAAATNVVVVSGTQITATTPAGSAGAVMVTVSNPGGQSGALAGAFTYIAPPTVTSVSPNTDPRQVERRSRSPEQTLPRERR